MAVIAMFNDLLGVSVVVFSWGRVGFVVVISKGLAYGSLILRPRYSLFVPCV